MTSSRWPRWSSRRGRYRHALRAQTEATSPAPQQACVATGGLRIVAWMASLGLGGALSYAVIAHRDAVMQAWAPSQRAYLAIGLAAPPGYFRTGRSADSSAGGASVASSVPPG